MKLVTSHNVIRRITWSALALLLLVIVYLAYSWHLANNVRPNQFIGKLQSAEPLKIEDIYEDEIRRLFTQVIAEELRQNLATTNVDDIDAKVNLMLPKASEYLENHATLLLELNDWLSDLSGSDSEWIVVTSNSTSQRIQVENHCIIIARERDRWKLKSLEPCHLEPEGSL